MKIIYKNLSRNILFSSLTTTSLHAQEKVNVILLGIYHFNNPGNDAMRIAERNILCKKDQLELEEIIL